MRCRNQTQERVKIKVNQLSLLPKKSRTFLSYLLRFNYKFHYVTYSRKSYISILIDLDISLALLSAAANHRGVFTCILLTDWLPPKVRQDSRVDRLVNMVLNKG